MGCIIPAHLVTRAQRAPARFLLRVIVLATVTAVTLVSRADAHSVAQVEATKFLAPETIQLLIDNATAGTPGFQTGDVASFIMDFAPIANGATIGAGGYLTEYVPSGTELIGAAIVQPDGFGDYVEVPPDVPGPISNGWGPRGRKTFNIAPWNTSYDARCAGQPIGQCNGSLAQLYADTGIFYSTDPRTAGVTCTNATCTDADPEGRIRQGTNGYNIGPTGEGQLNAIVGNPTNSDTTHNLWDAAQANAFGSTSAGINGQPDPKSAAPAAGNNGTGTIPFNAGSAVAGPLSGYQLDNTGNVGPWRRISYFGARIGTPTGPAISATASSGDPVNSATAVVGTYTTAGWELSPTNPLPANTNALRFAVGRLVVGQLRYGKISLRLTAPVSATGLVNNSEVFGGDSAQAAGKNGNDNPWRYHVPNLASSNANLFIRVEVVRVNGAPSSGALIPAAAKLRYRITYLNLSPVTQTSLVLSNTLPSETANGSVSNVVAVSGPDISTITPANPAGGSTFSFQTIPSLDPGEGGAVEFDVQTNAVNGDVVVDQSQVITAQLLSSLISRTISNTGTLANLDVSKSVVPTIANPGDTVTYTITVHNSGTGPASSIVVHDVLPTSGGALNAATRFNFVPGSSIITGIASVVPTTAAPPTLPPYTGDNREQVTWTFGGSLAADATFTIEFQATIGASVAVPAVYGNDGVVSYNNGATTMETTFPTSGPIGVIPPNMPPTIAVAASATPNPVQGIATTLSTLGADDAGEPNLTYTWALTSGPAAVSFGSNGTNAAKSSVATFTAAGSYTFTVTVEDEEGLTVTDDVTVTVVQTATSMSVVPTTANVHPHATQAYAATLLDQFGDPMAMQPAFNWAVGGGGTIDASGLFTAGATAGGPFTVTATDPNSGVQGTASATVVNDPPTVAVAASAAPNPTAGTTTNVSALGADDGGEPHLTYTWSVTGGPAAVSFGPNGTNAAQSSVATFTQAGSYTLRVTVTDEDGLTATDDVAVTVVQTASAVTVTPSAASVAPNGTQAYAATLLDQFGDPMAVQPTFDWMVGGGGVIDGNGVFTAGGLAGGPFVVTATDLGSGLSDTATVTIGNMAPTIAVAADATPNPVPGTTTTVSVLGADDGGEPFLIYTWSQTAGPAAVSFSPNGTNAAQSSVATFTRAGSYTLRVTVTDEGGLTATDEVAVTVVQTASTVTVAPPAATVAPHGTQAYAATLRDQFGAPMAVQPSFDWMVGGGGVIAASGLFTAGGTAGGPFVVTATDPGSMLSGTASVTVVNTGPTIAVAASATPNPVPGTTTMVSALGADDGGEPNLTYSWSATTGPAPVSFSPNGSNAAQSSVATFTLAGSYTLRVTVTDEGGLTTTSDVAVTVVQTATTVTVTPPAATVAPHDSQPYVAVLLDQFGDPMAVQPAFDWTVGGGGEIAATGLFTAGGLAGGPFLVTASDAASGLSNTATVTIVNAAPTLETAASATPNPVPGTTTNVLALGEDDGGESFLTYSWSVTSGPAAVSFDPIGNNSAQSSVATFTRAGSYILTVTVTDEDGLTVTGDVAVTVLQTASAVTVAPPAATVAPHGTQTYVATLLDQFGDPMAVQPAFDWTVGGGVIDAGGVFTAGGQAGGPFVVTATDAGSALSNTASVTVSNTGPTLAVAATATPNPVPGTMTTTSALGADDGGESNLTYTWSITAGPAAVSFSPNGTNAAQSSVATFTQAGDYTFRVTVTDEDGLTATDDVAVTVLQTPATMTAAPPAATVAPHGTQLYVATLLDQFGTPLATQPAFDWTVGGGGVIDASGVFTAGGTAGGPFVVTATDPGSGLSDTAGVTIANAAPTLAVAASATPNPVLGTVTTASALAADDGGESFLTYTWSVSTGPAAVSFTPNGTNAAQSSVATFSQPGDYTLMVTVTDEDGLTATDAVVVSALQTLASIAVSPPITVPLKGGTTFGATAFDQFGGPLAVQPAFVWSVDGGGTIDADGQFVSGGTGGGPFTVTATSGIVQATSAVTIEDLPPTIAVPAAIGDEPALGYPNGLSVLGDDDGGEPSLRYTWSADGPGTVTFDDNGTNAARNTLATFSALGTYTLTVTVTDLAQQSVASELTTIVQGAVLDANLYVRNARFRIDWKRHIAGSERDKLALTGFINPAGLPADLSDTAVALEVNGTSIASGILGTTGRYHTPRGVAPKLVLKLSPRNGRFKVRLARSDLRAAIGLQDVDASGRLVLPVTLRVSRAREIVSHNRLEFAYASSRARRTKGMWRGPKQRLLDGAFQLLRTRADFSRKLDGWIVRARGVIYPLGGTPLTPVGDLTLEVAHSPAVTIPLAALRRLGAGEPERAVWKYRSTDPGDLVASLVIKNSKRRLKLRLGRMPRSEAGMPEGAAIGARAELPLRLAVPTSAGTINFETLVELVHPRARERWKRPAPLASSIPTGHTAATAP
jgi:uncharacterized repeat protein (TIGR01451 family)